MRTTTGTLFRQVLTLGACAAMTLGGSQPAAAREHGHHERGARTATYTRQAGPAREPRAHYAAPRERSIRMEPRERFVRAEPRVRSAPRHYAAPRERFVRTEPRVQTAPRHYAAPRERFVRVAPRSRVVHENRAPFVQYVRANRYRYAPRFVSTRQVVRSPLMRAVYYPRTRRSTLVYYHPGYLAGRVVSVNRRVIVLAPPVGREIFVGAAPVANAAYLFPVGQTVTLPVTYANGGYTVYTQPTYYGNTYAPPAYCYGPSSTLYSAVLPAVIGAVSGNGSFNTSDLAALALSAAASSYGSDSCSTTYDQSAYDQPPYYQQANQVVYQGVPVQNYAYATPYDNCVYSDNYGDGYCAGTQVNPYAYNSIYAPQQVQGLVVAKTGTMLMVLGGNGLKPVFVNAAPALENGYGLNGPVAIGQVVDAVGYYNGDTFVATALQ